MPPRSSMPTSSMRSSRRSGRTSRPWRRIPGNRHRSALPPLPSRASRSLRKADAGTRPPGPVRGGPVFWVVGLGLAAGAFWVSGGHALVRQAPFATEAEPAQPIVNPLHIVDVTSRVEEHGGRPILFVEGKAVNEDRTARTLPRLEIDVTANDGAMSCATIWGHRRSRWLRERRSAFRAASKRLRKASGRFRSPSEG